MTNQCMGCQAGWPLKDRNHEVVGGYPYEQVACTKDVYAFDYDKFAWVVGHFLANVENGEEKLARHTGASRPTIKRWANGQSRPRPVIAQLIMDACEYQAFAYDKFAQAVGDYLARTVDGVTKLAEHFEAAATAPVRWASGHTEPRPAMAQLIMDFCEEEKSTCLDCGAPHPHHCSVGESSEPEAED